MKNVFSQATEISVKNTPISERLKILPQDILKHTDREYSCEITDKGCYLKPTFRNMPYKNSFVPEICVDISENSMLITGKPIKAVRIFNICFFSILLIIELLLLTLFVTSNLSSIFPLFIPIGIGILNFVIIKIGTTATFKSVVKAVRNEIE